MNTRQAQSASATLHEVIGQVAAEVAAPLTRALERVRALEAGGALEAGQLRALHDEVALARRVGILGQQIARLASGAVRQVLEPVELDALLRELIDEYRRDGGPAAPAVKEALSPAAVMADTGLAGALLRALLEWSGESALTPMELRLEPQPAAAHALLVCRFTRKRRAEPPPEPLSWHLMQFAAAPLGTRIVLEDSEAATILSLQFERLVPAAAAGSSPVVDTRLLAGCQLLVVSSDRDVRHQVRRAVQGLDLLVDYVASVDAAVDYCNEGPPQAVVYASTLAGAGLDRLRRRVQALAGATPFIEISPEGHGVEALSAAEDTVARLGLDGLAQALPAALAMQLARRRG